jgi:septal ring factor EnvC (AmiA/AmiB activator)
MATANSGLNNLTRGLKATFDMMKKVICLLFIILLTLNAHAVAKKERIEDEVTKTKEKLSDIDQKIKNKKKELTQAEKEELSTINQLNVIGKKLSKNQNEFDFLNRRLKNLKKEMLTIDSQLTLINQDIARREKVFNKRLSALYKYERSGGILRIIFSSDSYLDLSQRTKFIGTVLRSDTQMVQQFMKQLSLTKEKKEKLQENKKSLEKVKASIRRKENQIKGQKQKKTVFLKQVRNEKQTYQVAVRELEKSSRQLQSLIDGLKKELRGKGKRYIPEDGKGFAVLKGKLLFPIPGKIISRYGNHVDPQLNTVIFQKGIEISTTLGKEIKAIYGGKVLYADWFKGYGNIVIIDHGDSYYSLSAHLSKILKRTGDRVEAGEVIALTGDTGSLKGPCLYFELRHHGEPLNPLHWLRKK